jgi:hypothetical protein
MRPLPRFREGCFEPLPALPVSTTLASACDVGWSG